MAEYSPAVDQKTRLKNKTRILLEVHPSVIGGVERFLCNLVARLDRDRFEPVMVSRLDGAPLGLFQNLDVRMEVIDYVKQPKTMVRFLKDERVDVVQTNCFSTNLACAARASSIPHLWRAAGHRDLLPHDVISSEMADFLFQSMVRLSHGVICPSQFLRSQFAMLKGNKKVRVIYNGVNLSQIDAEAESDQPESQDESPCIGMIARILPQKRQIDFVHAARIIVDKVPGARFFIFGGADPGNESREYAELVAMEIQRLGLADHFISMECGDERFKAFSRMSVFVLPSLKEGASNALLEAMALGKPVVAARSGGNIELVREKRTGFLVPPENPQAIADAVLGILSDPRLARRLGRQGRDWVEKKFRIEDCVKKYEELWCASSSGL